MAQTILYYPTINIQDSAWLRNAVLYWDEVSSIVPYEDYPNFSPEVLFLQRSGVYKAVYPQKLFSSEFAEDFCNSIVKRIAAYEARTVNNENTNSRVRVHKNKVYAPALHELIHYRKLPPQLLGYFENKRYINDYNVDGWMEIDSKIAQIYMREASNPVPTPLLGHRCRSSQEITGSPTPFSTSNHYLWICESASFSLSNPNIAA